MQRGMIFFFSHFSCACEKRQRRRTGKREASPPVCTRHLCRDSETRGRGFCLQAKQRRRVTLTPPLSGVRAACALRGGNGAAVRIGCGTGRQTHDVQRGVLLPQRKLTPKGSVGESTTQQGVKVRARDLFCSRRPPRALQLPRPSYSPPSSVVEL